MKKYLEICWMQDAAKELYEQLPLSLAVQDYSDNEKIFYPPKALDVSDAPKAGGKTGTLAYYEPWADVVMFFESYSSNGSLYDWGRRYPAVSISKTWAESLKSAEDNFKIAAV